MKLCNDQIKLLADTAKGIGIGALCILIALGILTLLKEDE